MIGMMRGGRHWPPRIKCDRLATARPVGEGLDEATAPGVTLTFHRLHVVVVGPRQVIGLVLGDGAITRRRFVGCQATHPLPGYRSYHGIGRSFTKSERRRHCLYPINSVNDQFGRPRRCQDRLAAWWAYTQNGLGARRDLDLPLLTRRGEGLIHDKPSYHYLCQSADEVVKCRHQKTCYRHFTTSSQPYNYSENVANCQ